MKTLLVATLSCLLCGLLTSCASVRAANALAIDSVAAGAVIATSMSCSRCTDVRRLVIVNRAGGRCEVYYARHGSAEKVGEGDADSCQAAFDRVSIDLESSGFNCR